MNEPRPPGPRPAIRATTSIAALVAGAVCGLAWAASLRGWMVEIAGPSRSTVTGLTLLLVLLPGTLVGMLLAHAGWLGIRRRPVPVPLVFAPILLAAALLDPTVFHELITTGQGGGSLLVVITMLAGGYALGSDGSPVIRALTLAVAVLGLAAMLGLGILTAPPLSARGIWVGLYGASLVAVGAGASALPHRGRARV